MLNDYSLEVQKLFLEMLLNDAESFVRIQNIYNPANFDKSLQPAAKFIKAHYDEHGALPILEQVSAAANVKLDKLPELPDGNIEWFMEEFESFTKREELSRAILKSYDLLEKGEFGPVEKLIKDAVQISCKKTWALTILTAPLTEIIDILTVVDRLVQDGQASIRYYMAGLVVAN